MEKKKSIQEGWISKPREWTKPKETYKEDSNKGSDLTCFKCKKLGHMKEDYPLLKKDHRERRKDKKKAMIAAWGSESDSSSSEVEEKISNFCLMANEENEKVFDSSNDSLLDDDLLESYDEL